MSARTVAILALNELRLRMRRLSTLVAVLAVVVVSWSLVVDPSTGKSLLVTNGARILYTSSALALGSATLAGILFSLAGFYLLRGRIAEDLRCGIGSVIGASPTGDTAFLAGRWLGCAAYLGLLSGVFLVTMLVLQAVRGDGPVQPLVYLQAYALMLLPMVCFVASCAILFDSWAPLMGKGGDLLFFVLWAAQMSTIGEVAPDGALPLAALVDFNGSAVAIAAFERQLDTSNLGIGSMNFDAGVAPVVLPVWLWNAQALAWRAASAALALLPLVAAMFLFHRFSPDRVKPARARRRRDPLAVLNSWLRPLAVLVRPLLRLAARLPGLSGQVLADVALTLMAAPAAVAALLAMLVAAAVAEPAALKPLLIAGAAFWGVLVSDVSTRDGTAGCSGMTGAVPGGASRRYLRQLAAAVLLGWLFMGPAALRLLEAQPVRALATVTGAIVLAAFASLFGTLGRTPRIFLALFLFGLYVAINMPHSPMLDVVGFNGAANRESVSLLLGAGLLAAAVGYAAARRGRPG